MERKHFDRETVLGSIDAISTGEKQRVEEGNKILIEFLRSNETFAICVQIMQLKRDFKTCFISCDLLHQKVKNHWEEVKGEEERCRHSLFSTIHNLLGFSLPLDNKIASLTSSIVLRCMGEDRWATGVRDLAEMASCDKFFFSVPSSNGKSVRNFALRVLESIPNELETMSSVTTKKLRQIILSDVPFLMSTVQFLLEMRSREVDFLCLSLLKSWTQFGIPIEQICLKGTLNSVLGLMRKDIEYAGECVCILRHLFSSKISFTSAKSILETRLSVNNPAHSNIIQQILLSVVSFAPVFLEAEPCYSTNQNAAKLCTAFSQLVSALSCALMSWIQNNAITPICVNLLQVDLACYRSKQINISSHTLPFWNSLDNLCSGDSRFRPVFLEIFKISLSHSSYPAKFVEWHQEESIDSEEWDILRENSASVFENCFHSLGAELFLSSLLEAMHNSNGQWNSIESCLYAFKCVNKLLNTSETTTLVERIFDIIFISYSKSKYLCSTCCSVLSTYKYFISNNKAFLSKTLPFLINLFGTSMELKAGLQVFNSSFVSDIHHIILQLKLLSLFATYLLRISVWKQKTFSNFV